MLETLLKLYTMAMTLDVRSPTPHCFGPPGCGKSTFVHQLAQLVGKKVHTINVSRISPLELEGVQMPNKENTRLRLLTATHWNQLEDGDIVLLDEFLRGFPEVYNGLLDIMTSREVGGFKLPNVFFIAASNTTVAYDKALEDRLLHLVVPDPRSSKRETKRIATVIVEALGLLPDTATSYEMERLLMTEVNPTYELLDILKNKSSVAAAQLKGVSPRNLIGQAQLRHVTSTALRELIDMNNARAIRTNKDQYVFLLSGKGVDPAYVARAQGLVGNPRLTELQATNLSLNLQLIQLEEVRYEGRETSDGEDLFG